MYEYLENGSLDRVLFEHEQRRAQLVGDAGLGLDTLYGVVVGTARGVRYLHEECQHRIIHYDIKPGNVLLTADYSLHPEGGRIRARQALQSQQHAPDDDRRAGHARIRRTGAVAAVAGDAQV